MEFGDFLSSIKGQSSYIIERKLEALVRQNHNYRNLSADNQKIVLELIQKYRPKIRKGIGVSQYLINKDMYRLYQDRFKQDLTERDREQIRAILESLK